MYQKFKSFLADDGIFYTLLILLVAIASYGLGQRSALSSQKASATTPETPAVQIIEPQRNSQTSLILEAEEGGVAVVASKSGTKYHLPTCPGASQIKAENKVEFASIAEAEVAGYSPAANCEF